MPQPTRTTHHRAPDDLLTAGLGLDGLRAPTPPAFNDPEHPTSAELRRRAIWSNWRGIADLDPAGGYTTVYGSVASVPGREVAALATLPGARHPHRVLVQIPDAFDHRRRCVVVSASSGSRGIYGAIAVAGAWGLPKGCAVAYTDKGCGTDWFDLDAETGMRIDGTTGARGEALAFTPDGDGGSGEKGVRVNFALTSAQSRADSAAKVHSDPFFAASGIAIKHAHSQDNPEAEWGRHVKQAAHFALQSLDEAFPQDAPFTFDNTRVIAVGISNGGGAVLRAAEVEGDWLDAVVAAHPNIHVEGDGGRCLYDFTTEAALLMPCALLHPALAPLPQPPFAAQVAAAGQARCAEMASAGWIAGDTVAAQAASAYERLRANGWTDQALRAAALPTGFDLWRAIAVTYASSYGRYGAGEHPCGHRFATLNPEGSPRPATPIERAAWWSDSGGIAPGAGVALIQSSVARVEQRDTRDNVPQCPPHDPPHVSNPVSSASALTTDLQGLRALFDGEGSDAERVRHGIAETRANLPRAGLPILVIHGTDDGLIPMAFSSAPYVSQAQAAGRDVRYWQVRNVQHFDAFLAFPDYGARYLPLLPYVYAALDRVWAHLEAGIALPDDATIETKPRGVGTPLTAAHLAIPG